MKYAPIVNILKTKRYLNLLIFVLLVLIVIPLSIQKIIIPSFKNQIINNIINESKKIAFHFSNFVNITDIKNLSEKEVDSIFKKKIKEFEVNKMHYFNHDGLVVYSTQHGKKGTVNTHTYFKNVVSKGEIHYKVSQKGDKSIENEVLYIDTIEVYIPIMKDGKFVSALELYYDISSEMNSFRSLSRNILIVNISISIFAAILLFILLYNASHNDLKIKKYQKKLKELANNDPLTETYNRRYFYDIANNIIDLSLREKNDASVCMIDIDNFKNINDTFGHQVGDYVIKTLAMQLKDIVRKSDIVARYGGEEFIILFPNTNLEGSTSISEKICRQVEEHNFTYNNKKIIVTVSIGVSHLNGDKNLDEIIFRADKALYMAKKRGKNQVVKA